MQHAVRRIDSKATAIKSRFNIYKYFVAISFDIPFEHQRGLGCCQVCFLNPIEDPLRRFLATLRDAAAAARRDLRILDCRGAGPDHPVALECPETRYLKAVLLQVR